MASHVSRNSILTSIHQNGIVPRGRNEGNCIPSESDSVSANVVCMNYFHKTLPDTSNCQKQDPGPERVQHQIRSIVFDPKTGIIPVLTERHPAQTFPSYEAFLKELSSRVNNSVCFIINKSVLNVDRDGLKSAFGIDKGKTDVLTHYEVRTAVTIKPEFIHAILAPEKLVPTVEKVFTDVRLISLSTCSKTFDLGHLDDSYSEGGQMIQSYQKDHSPTLEMPDYVKGLNQLGRQHLERGFLIHTVRLPAEKKFKVSFNSKSLDKIETLKKDDRFHMQACEGSSNQYFITCKEEDVEWLRSFIK